jgi:hypothetical protein
MRVALWLVPGITLASMLVLGSFGFFLLLVGLNGVSEAKGGRLLTAYLTYSLSPRSSASGQVVGLCKPLRRGARGRSGSPPRSASLRQS